MHVGTNSLLRQALVQLALPMLKPECMLQLMPQGDRYLSVNGNLSRVYLSTLLSTY